MIQYFRNYIIIKCRLNECRIIYLKRSKVQFLAGIGLSNVDLIKQIEKEGYKYLGVLEFNQIIEMEMK